MRLRGASFPAMPKEPPRGGATAAYASKPWQSRGRRFPEPESATRTVFQRDRDRIVHSTAFRRLMYKTQVFVFHEGDHYRTRLTHSLEVAQIARSIARALALDEDLAEALALAHDLGHPPFGHAGEAALDAAMAAYGGFDHNAQTLRVLTRLEARYADFDGLNLTWETLEGVVKHNGPLIGPNGADRVPPPIAESIAGLDLALDTYASAEAQVAALADDIAYNNHDIDDGLRAGLFSVDDLAEVPLAGPVFAEVAAAYPGLEPQRLIHESVRRMIDRMVGDLIAESRRRLDEAAPASADAVRRLGRPVIAFSESMRANDRALKAFLGAHMYRHVRVLARTEAAKEILGVLFDVFFTAPERMPETWSARAAVQDEAGRARIAADYIAGMTDRYAIDEYTRIKGKRPTI